MWSTRIVLHIVHHMCIHPLQYANPLPCGAGAPAVLTGDLAIVTACTHALCTPKPKRVNDANTKDGDAYRCRQKGPKGHMEANGGTECHAQARGDPRGYTGDTERLCDWTSRADRTQRGVPEAHVPA